jgi:hypothetical protein
MLEVTLTLIVAFFFPAASTFDFPEMGGDHSETDTLDNHDVPDAAASAEFPVFQRDRAFSFEFFNFTGDELLPAAPSSATDATTELPAPDEPVARFKMRPRGDSIIFDPVSFQDGGIHEKNALLKGRGGTASISSAGDGLMLESRFTTANTGYVGGSFEFLTYLPVALTLFLPCRITENSLPKVPQNTTTPNPIPSYNVVGATRGTGSGQIATLPSALSANSSNVTSPATFQMELLNKDGRIGIYLPEARKARIARFHAKRKMRIWRKRIKYDCRKKLADSRPRIKGRFVKRSDMDE